MKIAVIVDTWFPFVGGGQVNAWEISKRIAEKGHKIDIITRNNGKDKLERVKNLNVYKLGSKSAPGNSLSKILFIIKSFLFVYRKNYDLVHAHAFLPGITARLLMVFKGTPAVFTVHGFSFNTNLNNFFSRWLEKFILTRIRYSSQITVSRDFFNIENINRDAIYIPNGVNTKAFDKIKMTKFKEPTIIFVGRLHPQKNLKTLLDASYLVKEKIPNIKLLIIGEGRLKTELQDQVLNLGLKNNVKFLGEKKGDDLIRLYKSSHVFILPSIYEGQPLTVLEAWAAKLPVIVTKTGDSQYLVQDGQNGYLVHDPSSPDHIARIIIKALNSKRLEKIGLNGYNLVKERFSWDKSAEKTLEIYKH